MLDHKVVLITGGTGSFGQKFTEIVLSKYRPKKLIIFSRDEMKQYEMAEKFKHADVRFFIGDIRDPERLHRAFDDVDIVIHAAAFKIVPTAEYNPFEAVRTNIIGTQNVINAAIDKNVEKVIAISTDKAASPVNLYGATKLCAEKIFIAANKFCPNRTMFSVVRYGNVFGSRGSVIPFFHECKMQGLPIPVTDVRMTRFWIQLEQGVEFVINCLGMMSGGEVFVPKLSSMRVVDLAKAIAPNSEIKITGIRPGEKLHETLVTADDARYTFEKADRFVMRPLAAHFGPVANDEKSLPEDFEGYHSNNNDRWLSDEELRHIIYKYENGQNNTVRQTIY
ncbi:UDP-N-acetylglucosamine 4,6-dehydratase (inverting) [Candidatus Falkowbacteria bacterium]|nr:UDP-N-acetylglucosamine 4,6-dehydratase (inverting) [Candidatus Falkowbacteria bacterium]